jgi:hypothetical protein
MWIIDAMYQEQDGAPTREGGTAVSDLGAYRFNGTCPTFAEINPVLSIAMGTSQTGAKIMLFAWKQP